MKEVIERRTYQVVFNFGSVVTLSVNFYEGDDEATAIRRRSEDIDGFIGEDGKYHTI